jgi:UDP-N-acetylmuramate: L-alanyl-gamma-D-glutamyl-meso-diaminopimelate ligase
MACLELHTYSSLILNFKEYEGALEYADVAVVFSPDAVKQLEEVSYDQIAQASKRLNYLYKSKDFKDYLFNLNLDNSALLLMSREIMIEF